MTHPVRLQLSRRKGFNLQAWSRQVNGLEAVNCTRAGRWGNPFVVSTKYKPGTRCGGFYIAVPNLEDAVTCFEEWLSLPDHVEHVKATIIELRGKNLACYCRLCPKHAEIGKPLDEHCHDCAPCHVDVLGDIICEAVG